MHGAAHPPQVLRQYAVLADGERGALVGPRGDIAFLCAPRWHDDAVFATLLGGRGSYSVTPVDRRHVWGGHYERDSLIWRSRWVTTRSVIECREALAIPTAPDRLVLLRRVEAPLGDAQVVLDLECRAEFGERPMTFERTAEGVWEGRTGDLTYRWSGAPSHTQVVDGRLVADLVVREGTSHDLVLELARGRLPEAPAEPDPAWERTERGWAPTAPALDASIAPGESHHSYAVLRGLTSADGGMVAAATTSLPERAERGRDYDYRYAWIRDQCYAGQAAAAVGGTHLLDSATRFVTERALQDGAGLRPAYAVDGGPVPEERTLGALPGYPGAPVRVGNHVGQQFQLDIFGEALLLLAAAAERDRLDRNGLRAVEALADAVEARWDEPDAGVWELQPRRWAHSRLICAAGLRAAAAARGGPVAADWEKRAELLVDSVNLDCRHPSGRWQRAPDDGRIDAALLAPGIRGAVSPDDPTYRRTLDAVLDELADDGYVYRFRREGQRSAHEVEGAFLMCGFQVSLALLAVGDVNGAVRWFERNRGALGPPGLFAEEFDVVQRQLRGNLPQAFVHAVAVETAQRLGEAGVSAHGFEEGDR